MQKVIVNIDNPADADFFLKMVDRLNFVESARIENKEYDWTNPTRPATEEECEMMIAECETEYKAGAYIPIDDARKQTMEEIAKWRKEQ